MRRLLPIAAVALVLGCASGPSADWMDGYAADQRRRAAQVAADPVALDQVLNESLVYRHSDGRAETKRELIESLVSGAVNYRAIDVDRLHTVLCPPESEGESEGPPAACILAFQTLHVSVGDDEFTVVGCYRARYLLQPEAPQMVSYESALLSEDGECPLR